MKGGRGRGDEEIAQRRRKSVCVYVCGSGAVMGVDRSGWGETEEEERK